MTQLRVWRREAEPLLKIPRISPGRLMYRHRGPKGGSDKPSAMMIKKIGA